MNSIVQETIEQLPSDYIYTEMFKAIDIQQEGVIGRYDMNMAAKAAGWNEAKGKFLEMIKFLVSELISELDPNHDGSITFEEFILIMKYIE